VQASQGDRAAAVDSYTKACDLFPAYGAAHFALAQELRHAGQAADAQRHVEAYAANATASPPLEDPLFQRISELNHGAQAHMQRSAELERAGRLDDAVREQEAALAADPLNVQVRVNLISLYGRTGNPAKAQEQFESAIRLNPGRSDAWYNYGVLLLHERASFAEAERAFRRAVEINPDHAESHDHLGMLYEQQGRLDDAAVEFRHAVAAKPDYPAARFHLGRILVNQQKYDEAIRQFLRALDPETEQTPACLYALGATYARSGDRPRAVEYLRKARAAAVTHSQQQLLAGIDRDLKTLEDER
jgi:Tfp pilus assembly protein PilF